MTVNSDWYVNMLQEFFFPRLDELDLGGIWVQQGGPTAHTSKASIAVLREHFPLPLISIRGDLEWPARSPDLAPCDFFLVKDPTRFENQHPGRNCQHNLS